MEIVVDNRERAVIPFMEDLSHEYNIDYNIKTLTTGDYAICYKGFIMLIIERKTYADLAASMRDGRKENINKLISLRKTTNCQIIYMIEGEAFPKPTKLYSRLPFKNLQAHLDHIAFRDNVHIIYTKDQNATAERLFILARNYGTIKPSMLKVIDDKTKTKTEIIAKDSEENDNEDVNEKNEEKDDEIKDQDIDQELDQELDQDINITYEDDEQNSEFAEKKVESSNSVQDTNIDNDTVITDEILDIMGGNMSELTKKQVSQINIQEQLLRCLPGIGSIIATILAENKITLYGLYHEHYSIDHLARLKFPLGCSLGLAKATKIYNIHKLLSTSKSTMAEKIRIDILSTIPGVSKASAKKIITVVKFSKLMSGGITVDELKEVQRSPKSKVGITVATKILNHLIPNTKTEKIEEKTEEKITKKTKTKKEKTIKKVFKNPPKRGAKKEIVEQTSDTEEVEQ